MRDIMKPKFAVKGSVCKVVKQVDHNVLLVEDMESGRAFRCNVDRVSKLPRANSSPVVASSSDEGSESGSSDHGEQANAQPAHGVNHARPPNRVTRRSGRVSQVPMRFDDYHMH